MIKFQPILNFESLTPQTTKGDLIGRTTTGATRVAVGADNTVLTADSSTALGVKWASVSANIAVNTLTGATTLPATSQVVLVSGTTFAITFPAASGNSGLEYIIQKTDSGIITPISIANSNGVAGTTFQTHLESYHYICDGATYWPIDHYAETPWSSTATISLAATGTALAKGTVVTDSIQWKRMGNVARFRVKYRQSTTGTTGTGIYIITLPTGMTIDTTLAPGSTNTGDGSAVALAESVLSSSGWVANNSERGPVFVRVYDSTRVAVLVNTAAVTNQWGQNAYALGAQANLCLEFEFDVPLVGWAA